MARDAKFNLTFTRDVSAVVANGLLRVANVQAAASTTETKVFVYADAVGTSAHRLYRASTAAVNFSGFRNTLADASVLVSQAGGSAIVNDPAITGPTAFSEMYCRVAFAAAGVAPASNTRTFLVVEGASDSGTGTAGSDWQAVSPQIDVASAGAPRSITFAGTAATGGVFSVTGTGHGLAVGDIVVFTAAATGTLPDTQRPYYVATVPSATTFTLATTIGGAADTSFAVGTATATATSAVKRLLGINIVPTVRPWLRLSVIMTGTGTVAATQGVWLQDPFIAIGRDSAAVI